jgi:hypothetical protein
MQENGSTRPGVEAARGLRIYYLSSWAEGAAGYFWWGSHMIDRKYKVNTPGLRADYSSNSMKVGDLGGDRTMGLLSIENVPEISGLEYKECTRWIDQLGVGWKDHLPVSYIIMPHTTEFYNTMLKFITPFVLAKQAHFDVKLLWEDQEIPGDASAVIIPGFQLSPEGKKNVEKYLTDGGNVYQSYYNDIASGIQISDKPSVFADSLTLYTSGIDGNNAIRIKKIEIRDISYDSKVKMINTISNSEIENGFNKIFLKTRIGKGTYYYLSVNIEESLAKSRNPWLNDDSYIFYEVLKPKTDFQIDNKFIEFYHKKRGKEELLVLINHENTPQSITIKSNRSVKMKDAISSNDFGKGVDFNFQLKPAEAIFLKVN